jgi:hypothetical protein
MRLLGRRSGDWDSGDAVQSWTPELPSSDPVEVEEVDNLFELPFNESCW